MASKYLQKYQVPEGFYDILHEFSREVLRAQPEDIIEYAAHYFEHKAQGKEYYYESKYNIQRPTDKYEQQNQKQYKPTPHQNYTEQANKVVQSSNQRVDAQSQHNHQQQQTHSHEQQQQQSHQRNQSNQSGGRPHTQNSIASDKPNDTSKISSKSKKSDVSHPEEKKISKEFVGDLYNSALHKAMNPSRQQQEQQLQQSEQEGGYDQEQQQEEEGQEGQQNYEYEEGEGQEDVQYDQQQQYYEGGEEQQQEQYDSEQQQQQQQEEQEGEEGAEYDQEQQQEQEQGEEQLEEEGSQQLQQQQAAQGIVLDGPVEEYENVALKIQSVFRGNKVRKDKK